MGKNDCYALLRWDLDKDMNAKIFLDLNSPRCDSQDVWAFKGAVREIQDSTFTTGKRGCDNRIAFLIDQAGYNITNPCFKIKAYHYHVTEKRNYFDKEVIQPPYKLIPPTE